MDPRTPITADEQTTVKVLAGWQVTETAGAAASVKLRDGGSSGDSFAFIKLVAGESVGETYPDPIRSGNGVYVDVVSGAVDVVLYEG